MSCRSFVLGAFLAAAIIVAPAHAHHSQAMYDTNTWVSMEGTVKQVLWVFPHAWVHVEVRNERNEVAVWALEGANPNAIREAGVSRESIRANDRIRFRCHPMRDGSEACVLGFVTPLHGDAARGHGVEKAWN